MRALRTNGLDNPYPFEFAKKFIEHGAREERRTEKICNKIKWLSYQTPTVLDEMLDVLLDVFYQKNGYLRQGKTSLRLLLGEGSCLR
jgi:hypothetical protein